MHFRCSRALGYLNWNQHSAKVHLQLQIHNWKPSSQIRSINLGRNENVQNFNWKWATKCIRQNRRLPFGLTTNRLAVWPLGRMVAWLAGWTTPASAMCWPYQEHRSRRRLGWVERAVYLRAQARASSWSTCPRAKLIIACLTLNPDDDIHIRPFRSFQNYKIINFV